MSKYLFVTRLTFFRMLRRSLPHRMLKMFISLSRSFILKTDGKPKPGCGDKAVRFLFWFTVVFIGANGQIARITCLNMTDVSFLGEIGSPTCCDVPDIPRQEWLITNGIGGYGMGSVCGMPARQYHGVLIGALNPPLGRTLIFVRSEETLHCDGQIFSLFANQLPDGSIHPRGFDLLVDFHLEGTTPVWTYQCADALLEKRMWMEQGENTTYMQYRLVRASAASDLHIRCLTHYRDHHDVGGQPTWLPEITPVSGGLVLRAFDDAVPLFLRASVGVFEPKGVWLRNYFLSIEAHRGQHAEDAYLLAAELTATLSPEETLTLVASIEPDARPDGDAALERRRAYEGGLLTWVELAPDATPAIRQLTLAADQFIVARPDLGDEQGGSVIAGYPWFGDWGRDTMISLPGLTLVTGRYDLARRILLTFARFVDRGMLPNRFPDAGKAPEYNTVDATLWYFEAIRAYVAITGNEQLLVTLFPVLADIVEWHQRGTRYNIHVDPADGLIAAGETGVQLTWMDAIAGDWVVTPRIGKPVEINALWYNALRIMADFANRMGEGTLSADYGRLADRVRDSFGRFWNGDSGYCYDVLDGPGGNDPALRPNQLLAVSLPYSPLTSVQQKAVVDVCAHRLLTPYGLRSLDPGHSDYIGRYGGDRLRRDAAYHQGTVWGWLIGPFVSAHLRVYDDAERALSFLQPLFRHLVQHGVGSISEIFDGDPPHAPRGCPAQAWSVAEVLRVWGEIHGRSNEATRGAVGRLGLNMR